MELTLLTILYGVLIVFTTIIGTLLSILLYKLLKVVNALTEIVEVYNSIKGIFMLYSQIPDMIFHAIKDFLLGKKR